MQIQILVWGQFLPSPMSNITLTVPQILQDFFPGFFFKIFARTSVRIFARILYASVIELCPLKGRQSLSAGKLLQTHN